MTLYTQEDIERIVLKYKTKRKNAAEQFVLAIKNKVKEINELKTENSELRKTNLNNLEVLRQMKKIKEQN